MNYLTNKRMRNGIATRRQLLLALGAGALGTARLASAQQPAPQPSLPRIVFISPIGAAQSATRIGAFKDGLRINGLVEGRHYVVDVLYAEGQFERFPALVQQALQRGPAVFVLVAPASVRAAQAATKTIPIVFVTAADPVGAGLVASLARPGGNTTGVIGQADELALKHVGLLHEALPRARRIAVLSAADTAHAKVFDRVSAVATGFGMSARRFEAGSPAVHDAALEAIAQHRPDALLILTYAPFFWRARSHRGGHAQGADSGVRPGSRIRRRRLPDVVCPALHRDVSLRRAACEENPRRHQARRPAGRAADPIRDGGQPENRRGARHQDSAFVAGAGGAGDRMKQRHQHFNIAECHLSKTIGACGFTATHCLQPLVGEGFRDSFIPESAPCGFFTLRRNHHC